MYETLRNMIEEESFKSKDISELTINVQAKLLKSASEIYNKIATEYIHSLDSDDEEVGILITPRSISVSLLIRIFESNYRSGLQVQLVKPLNNTNQEVVRAISRIKSDYPTFEFDIKDTSNDFGDHVTLLILTSKKRLDYKKTTWNEAIAIIKELDRTMDKILSNPVIL